MLGKDRAEVPTEGEAGEVIASYPEGAVAGVREL